MKMGLPIFLVALILGAAALVAGCGEVEELVEGESGEEFAERNAPVPEDADIMETLDGFQDAIYEDRAGEACRYLTARGFRELVDATIVEGEIDVTYEECPQVLTRLADGGLRSHQDVEIDGVTKEEYEGKYYLVVDVDRGPGLIMTFDGGKIASFNGPE